MIVDYSVSIGCDPELFVKKGRSVIGSEKVVPVKGFNIQQPGNSSVYGKIIRDGVQVEFNPMFDTCRQVLSTKIAFAIQTLHRELKEGMKISFDTTVRVSKKELASLLPENQVLGCNASQNIYDPNASTGVKDGATFLRRSAGGHIHLGFYKTYGEGTPNPMKDALQNVSLMVPILDILVGNTMVLIDRDEGNRVRRRTYGRAGEYRQPAYGLEYRTLSNFWLKNYVLMSFVFGLTRQAVRIVANNRNGNDTVSDLLAAVDISDIRKAINKNDAELAAKNFEKIAPIIARLYPSSSPGTLNKMNLKAFRHFVNRGMDYWFTVDPLAHWLEFKGGTREIGWEQFIFGKVTKDMKDEEEVEKKPAVKVATRKVVAA